MEHIAAIPTTYNDINFRSRLEARWAAFFDLLKWDWEYEPIDLPGWIPDFKLKGKHELLVEIKPYCIKNNSQYDDDYFYEDDKSEWKSQINKILKSKPQNNVLLLGNGFYEPEYATREKDYFLGSILYFPSDPDYFFEHVYITWSSPYCIASDPEQVAANSFSYSPSIRSVMTTFPKLPLEQMYKFWKEAGNIVQWKKPKIDKI